MSRRLWLVASTPIPWLREWISLRLFSIARDSSSLGWRLPSVGYRDLLEFTR
ncbi:hypothetical protein AB0E59_07575 [Lentzea sp. NPDC034063]|uniref:hypothetical protein n=1 Tax=unclassified Lentzea TaxID=2643253 RepID=UPI0033F4ACC7